MLNWILKKKAKKQLIEPRPLPLGRKEFDKWSDEIIDLAQIPGATRESQKFALAEMVLHVKPTESFASYAQFVHQLRKGAANQVAHAVFMELKEKRNKQAVSDSQGPKNAETKILADSKV